MTPELIKGPAYVSREALAYRKITLNTIGRLFLRRLEDRSYTSPNLEELADEAYGNLLVFSHFSRKDIPISILTVFENPTLRNRKILIPYALHQYQTYYGPAGELLDITLLSLVTQDTILYAEQHPNFREQHKQFLTKEGMVKAAEDYFKQGLEILNDGGVVILFPQGGRRPSLDEITNAVRALINRANRTSLTRFTVTFFGLGIKGETDYAKKNGFNLLRTYEVNRGRSLKVEELIKEAKDSGKSVDQITLEELQLLVPPDYLPKI